MISKAPFAFLPVAFLLGAALPLSVFGASTRGTDPPRQATPEQKNAALNHFSPSRNSIGIVRVGESDFKAEAGLITFSEMSLDTYDPVYYPQDYGGGIDGPKISFSGYFSGQALGDENSCPPGAALSGCVVGNPLNPLALDYSSPKTFITDDGANPTSPVLSGSPQFNGPVAVLFDQDIAGVGLNGGYFDSTYSVAIAAYDRSGQLLGAVVNTITGIEFFGLVTADGSNKIAGILFSIVGDEPAGFAIDNLRFAKSGQIVVPKTKSQISVKDGFIKLDTTSGQAPDAADCSIPDVHYGRMVADEINGILYICTSSGWHTIATN